MTGSSRIKGAHLAWLSMFCLLARAGSWLSTQATEEAIISGEFLEFDSVRDRYAYGQVQKALVALHDEIRRLRREEAALSFTERDGLVREFKGLSGSQGMINVENIRLIGVMSVHDRHKNAVTLSKALLRALGGMSFVEPNLVPATPFADEAEQLERERPSDSDITAWVDAAVEDTEGELV